MKAHLNVEHTWKKSLQWEKVREHQRIVAFFRKDHSAHLDGELNHIVRNNYSNVKRIPSEALLNICMLLEATALQSGG